jgi:phenylacetate-coenzyme A ligase PaaK-like adenylate-forming protein
MNKLLENQIFGVNNSSFDRLALDIFRYQASHNQVYGKFIELLRVIPEEVENLEDIPFLPISLFKTQKVSIDGLSPEIVFSSSGTTGIETSKHHVASQSLYEKSFLSGFNLFYGDPSKYCILALLPSYLERDGSSLVYMVNMLINESKQPQSGFFLHNHNQLVDIITKLEARNQPAILLGVTFALLDLADQFKLDLKSTIVMETGGMKGRGEELIRSQVHTKIHKSFGLESVHSEYGMTELLSQAYSKGNGVFNTPPWMRVMVRDPYDPFTFLHNERSGALNIIDLANIYSCSFIQTDDAGIIHNDGSFEVLGRMDGSQIRGCNLMVI